MLAHGNAVGLLEDSRPRITGKAWICNGLAQDEWDFALLLPKQFVSREEIEWASLLPSQDVTRWIAFDESSRYIEIEPTTAEPDLTEPDPTEDRGSI